MRKLPVLTFLLVLSLVLPASAQLMNFDWARGMGGAEDENPHSIAVDKDGSVIAAGSFRQTVDFNPGTAVYNLTAADEADAFIVKLDVNGDFLWARGYGGIRNDWVNSVAVDTSGNIYVTGIFVEKMDFGTVQLTSEGEEDVFIAKLDPNGNCLWAKNIGSPGDEQGLSLDLDPWGNMIVIGNLTKGQVDMDPGAGTHIVDAGCLFILKLTTAGDFIWVKRIEDLYLENVGEMLAVSNTGAIHIAGSYHSPVDFDPARSGQVLTPVGGIGDAFVVKLDSAGNYEWARTMGGPDEDASFAVAVDKWGNVYTNGSFARTAVFGPLTASSNNNSLDIFITRLDASGNFVWTKIVGGNWVDRAFGIAVDEQGGVYSTGGFNNVVDFNPGTNPADTFFLSTVVINNWVSCSYLLKLDSLGGFQWAKSFGGAVGTYSGLSIRVDNKGSVYSAGNYQGAGDFDPGPATYPISFMGGNADAYVHKMSCEGGVDSTIKLSACGSYTFNGSTYTESGVYVHRLNSFVGCESKITLDLTINHIEKPFINVEGYELSTSVSYFTYQWYRNGVKIDSATGRTHEVSDNGDYTVVVTDRNGCTDTSKIYGVNNYSIGQTGGVSYLVNVYPNPATDMVYIQSSAKVQAILTNVEGRRILNIGDAGRFSMKALSSGLYLLHIADEQGRLIEVRKMVRP